MPPRKTVKPDTGSGLAQIFADKGPKMVDAVSVIKGGDRDFPPFTPEESSWGDDYAESKSKFRRAAHALHPAVFESINLRMPDGTPMNDENGVPLSTDIAIFGNIKDPQKCFISSSGVHGPEGFAGSAGQVAFLRSVAARTAGVTFASDACYIFVHAVNPWGMAHGRRWNENGVDLNRNQFVRASLSPLARRTAQSPYEARGTAPAFHRLAWILSTRLPIPRAVDTVAFFLVAAVVLITFGHAAIRQAIAGGQCAYPNAPFYGGVRLESGPRALWERLIAFWRTMPTMPKVFVQMDMHTGLGKHACGFGLTDSMAEHSWWVEALRPVQESLGVDGGGSTLSVDPPGGKDSYATGGASRAGLREALCVLADERARPGMGASGFSGQSAYAAAAAKGGTADALRTVVGASEVGDIPVVTNGGYVVMPGGEHLTSATLEIGTYGNVSVLRALREECGEFNALKQKEGEVRGRKAPLCLPPSNPGRKAVVRAFRPPSAAWEEAGEKIFVRSLAAVVSKMHTDPLPVKA